MQELLPSLVAAVVVELIGPEILHCLGYGPDFVQGLCLCGVVVEIVVVYYRSLPLNCCQWMEQPQLMGVSVVIIVAIHTLVLPAILQSCSPILGDYRV